MEILEESLSGNRQPDKSRSVFRVFGRLLSMARGLEGWMLLAILAGTAGFACALAIPVTAMLGAAGIIGQNSLLSFGSICWILALCAVFRGVLRYGEQACNHYIAFRLLAQIRDRVFGKLRTLGPAKLDGKSKGDLIALITSDVELLEVFYAHTISPVCIALVSAVLYVSLAAMVNGWIALLLGISYGFVALVIPLLFGKKGEETGIARRQANARLGAVVLENVRGIQEIGQYGMKEQRRKEMDEKTADLLRQEKRQRKQMIASSNTALAAVSLFSLAMVLLCIALVQTGAISWSMALAAVVFQASSFGPFLALANLSTGLSQTLGAARRVIALLDETPVTPDVETGAETAFDGMRVENLNFAYEKKPVLSGLSLNFERGAMIGIEGKSGCGKSTLLRMLMRFYDPDQGRVSLSGKNLKELRTGCLRQSQSVVLQQTTLFTDTIRNNLLAAKPDASEEEIRAAARKANIDSLIESLPEGYDTLLAEGGSSLSSGERQRLGLARAFLHDAGMMLLDEPTSNLDSLNEGAILRAVAEEARGKTVVLISHRKGSLSFADRIVHMEEAKHEPGTKA